jgi:uncharacterized repeat protein (TIGR03803 family)
LTLGSDGNFYGTTTGGGSYGNGIVFRLLVPPGLTGQPQSQTKFEAIMGAGAVVVVVGLIVSFYRYRRRKGTAVDIALNCSKCGQHIVIDEAGAGLQVECPACGAALVVPRPEAGQAHARQAVPPPPIPPPLPSSVSPPKTADFKKAETKKCPFCAEMIRAEAIKCKHCGSMLNKTPPLIQQAGAKPGKLVSAEWFTGEKPGQFSSREWLSGAKPGKYSCPSCHSTATNCQRAIGLPIIILIFFSCGLGLILLFFLPYNCTCLNCGFKWKS